MDKIERDEVVEQLRDMPYPVILKPVESMEGKKLDITICEDESEYMEAVRELSKKGYTRVLAQPYLKNRQEYLLTGAISKTRFSYTVVHHLRQWPLYMGCGSYSEFVKIPKITNYCADILKKIQQSGYTGLIDIEFFSDEHGQLFLNEINWRSSGGNYVSLYTEVFPAYQYYCDILNESYDKLLENKKPGFRMNEATDIRHVFAGKISLMQWLWDLKRTNSFAVWYHDDTKPFFARIMYYVAKCPSYFVTVSKRFLRGKY